MVYTYLHTCIIRCAMYLMYRKGYLRNSRILRVLVSVFVSVLLSVLFRLVQCTVIVYTNENETRERWCFVQRRNCREDDPDTMTIAPWIIVNIVLYRETVHFVRNRLQLSRRKVDRYDTKGIQVSTLTVIVGYLVSRKEEIETLRIHGSRNK